MPKLYGEIHKSFKRCLPKVSNGRWYKNPRRHETKPSAQNCGQNEILMEQKTVETKTVLIEVLEERIRQDKKWGEQNHCPFKYLAILGEEVGESNKAAIESYDFKSNEFKRFPTNSESKLDEYRMELIQVAAVAVAAVECLDRNSWGG